MEGFGARIVKLRAARDLTQEQLAEISKLGVRTVGKFEKLEAPSAGIRLSSLEALAAALDVPIDLLLHGEEEYAAVLKREWRRELADLEHRLDDRLKRGGL